MFRRCWTIGVIACWLPIFVSAETESHWRSIEQPMFNLIYEANIQNQAERVAAQLNHYLTVHLTEIPLKQPIKPIPIILYSRAHTSNGNVGLMPYRSRWFNKPAPFAQLEWYDALAVHEGRHIIQFNQLNDNPIAHALSYALGETGTGLFAGLFVPSWYFEGDAVVSETLMTKGGRGRVASFDLWYRTDLIEHGPYKYDRAMLGTGFDRTPSHSPYVLGRYLTAYLRNNYGSDVFDRVIEGLAIPKGISFDGSIKAETGAGLTEHYRHMTQVLTTQWQKTQDALVQTPVNILSKFQGDHWQSYYPVALAGDVIYSIKVDSKLGSSLQSLSNDRSRVILPLTNRITSNYYGGSKTAALVKHKEQWCWIEEKPNSKKPYQETADLYCWSNDGGERQLSQGERFTYLGTNQDQFLLNRFNVDRTSELVLLDKKGGMLQVESLPNNSIAYDIRSSSDGWLFVLAGSEQDGIYYLDAQLTQQTLLKANSGETLRSPILTDNWLVYLSDRSGIDQVHALSLNSGKTFQIATRPYGSYFLQWDSLNQRIVMSDYTAHGQQLVSIPFLDATLPAADWIEITSDKIHTPLFMDKLIQHDPLVLDTDTVVPLPSQPYSVSSHLWNPHSWGFNYNGDKLKASISSEDLMEKLNLQLNAGFDESAADWFGLASARYRTEAGQFLNATVEKSISSADQIATSWQIVAEQPSTHYFGINQSSWLPYIGVGRKQVSQDDALYRLTYGVNYLRQQERAFQAIETPSGFAQSFMAQYYFDQQTMNWLSDTNLAFEGILPRHGVNFSLSFQHLNYPESLLGDSPIFDPITQLGFSAQTQAEYRINLGAAGYSFTPLLYWRNTEVSINFLSQHLDEQYETALGLSLSPNINVLRNANIQLKPSVAVYYSPESGDVNFRYQVSLGRF